MGSTRTTAAKRVLLRRSARDDLVLQLRMRGMDYRSISKTMKEAGYRISHAHVGRIVNARLAELAKNSRETAEGIREIEIRRLDALLDAVWPRAMGDEEAGIDADLAAVTTALKVADRRAKLMGLDAPTKVEATGKDGAPLHPPVIAEWNMAALTVEQLEQLAALQKLMVPTPTPQGLKSAAADHAALPAHLVPTSDPAPSE